MSSEVVQRQDGGKQVGSVDQARSMLEGLKGSFEVVLPKGMSAARFQMLVVGACKDVPELLACDRFSFLRAVKIAAELGLEPNGPLGHGWLIPYGREAKFVPGYRGFIELAHRSGEVVTMTARVVYEGETFQQEEGLTPILRHVPRYDIDRSPKSIVLVYAIAKMRDGTVATEVMSRADVDGIMARSASAKSRRSPWTTDYAEMARKTPIRRLAKYLPLSSEKWRQLLEADNEDYPEQVAVRTSLPLREPEPRAARAEEPPMPEPPPETPKARMTTAPQQAPPQRPVVTRKTQAAAEAEQGVMTAREVSLATIRDIEEQILEAGGDPGNIDWEAMKDQDLMVLGSVERTLHKKLIEAQQAQKQGREPGE